MELLLIVWFSYDRSSPFDTSQWQTEMQCEQAKTAIVETIGRRWGHFDVAKCVHIHSPQRTTP